MRLHLKVVLMVIGDIRKTIKYLHPNTYLNIIT